MSREYCDKNNYSYIKEKPSVLCLTEDWFRKVNEDFSWCNDEDILDCLLGVGRENNHD